MDQHGVGYSARGLVAQLRDDGFVTTVDGATVKLAEAYGFCWGVERAVQMAYEAQVVPHKFANVKPNVSSQACCPNAPIARAHSFNGAARRL